MNEKEKKPSEFLTLAGTKGRGWTDAAVKKWLGDPDKTSKNPHYRSGPPTKLFLITRIQKVEETEEFQNWLKGSAEKRKRQSEIQTKLADTRREELLAYINDLKIKGVVILGDKTRALIQEGAELNDYHQNDTVYGYKIKEIGKKGLQLEKNGEGAFLENEPR